MITALPLPPSRQDPINFSERADEFLGALPTFGTEANALAVDANNAQSSASASASLASTKASDATLSASLAEQAAASAGSIAWVSGTTYAIGALRYSPANFQTYRRKTAGAGTTDPSTDTTNWVKSFPGGLELIATITPTVAANLDFLSVFSATYDNYLVIGQGIRFGTDDGVNLRLAVAGAADAGSNYYITNIAGGASGGSSTSVAISTATIRTAGFGCDFMFDVVNATAASSAKMIHGQCTWVSTVAGPVYTSTPTMAVHHGSAATGLRLYSALGGNFAATGKVSVYGYSKT